MTTFCSATDGVELAYWTSGEGPTLVLVHGGGTDHRCFNEVLPHFRGYRVVSYDRRGHGESGDADGYSLDREAADLADVIAHVTDAGAMFVLGYSYGATVAAHLLSTARVPIDGAVLYEPPMAEEGIAPRAAEIVSLIDAERLEEATRLFVESTFHLPAKVVDLMESHPMWTVSVSLVHTLRRELPVVLETNIGPPAGPTPPTRVLVAEAGGNPAFGRIASRLASVLPDCDIVPVPGVPHFAMASRPAEFAAAVNEHFARTTTL